MKFDSVMSCIEAAQREEVSTPEEAFDRVRVWVLRAYISENVQRRDFCERDATRQEAELERIEEKHGWVVDEEAGDGADDF